MKRGLAILGGVLLLLAALVLSLNLRGEDVIPDNPAPFPASPVQVVRGEYLARVGNCMGCHTVRGGEPYAGGRGFATPFGTVYTPNLTPDAETGIGGWSSAHFWRALHNGRSRDGRLLYPVFPYPNYTQVTREDSDALYAYLRSLAPVKRANQPHALDFPYNSQASLAVWRALYFAPGQRRADPAKSAEWNRGAYLVQGLGHCNACHSSRNALGAPTGVLDLGGGLIPMQNWYAPSLTSPDEAGVSTWEASDIVNLLRTGVAPGASVTGPMAEVVLNSTQYLDDNDSRAMAVFLKDLPALSPPHAAVPARAGERPPPGQQTRGAKLYEQHCAQCHGDGGEGAPGAYPALAGNRAVTMASPANLVRIVLEGGFAPATAGNPRPYGMPPFATALTSDDVAAVLTHLRTSWGNQAPAVTAVEVNRYRGSE